MSRTTFRLETQSFGGRDISLRLCASVVNFFSGLEIDRDSCESSSIATNVSNSLRVLSALGVQFSLFLS